MGKTLRQKKSFLSNNEDTSEINPLSTAESSFDASFNDPSSIEENLFIEVIRSDDKTFSIEKFPSVKETSSLCKIKPQRSHLPFKKIFLFEYFSCPSDKKITLDKIFPLCIII